MTNRSCTVAVALAFAFFGFHLSEQVRRPVPIDRMASARVAVAYSQAREALDYFARCDPLTFRKALQDERIAVQKRFVEMRQKVVAAGFNDTVELVDMEQQVLSEDDAHYVDNAAICQRMGDAGARTQDAVVARFLAVEQLLVSRLL